MPKKFHLKIPYRYREIVKKKTKTFHSLVTWHQADQWSCLRQVFHKVLFI